MQYKRNTTQSSQGYSTALASSGSGSGNSLIASTISLLGQHQQQQHKHKHKLLAPTMPESDAAQRKQHTKVGNAPLLLFGNTATTAAAARHTKLLLPGAAAMRHQPVDTRASYVPNPLTSTKSTKWITGNLRAPTKHAIGVTNQRSVRCIRRPPLWQHSQHRSTSVLAGNSMEKQRRRRRQWTAKGKDFIVEFLEGSSIHGLIYLAKIGLSLVERMLWFAFICLALFSIISLSQRTWQRFQNSPMVISMDRNKLVWNTSFPSLTVCPHKRIDEQKVDEYIYKHPQQFTSEEEKETFHDFIVKLASLSYDNIESLPLNNSFGIRSDEYLDILHELKWHFEPEISSGAAVKMYISETQTEFGICHSVNSLVARYNSYDYWRNNDWYLMPHGDRVTVHPLEGEIYAQIINLSTAYDVYFHGAGDVPSISKQRYTFPESDYTTVELIALEIFTNEEARAFNTKQRKCRFHYEAEEMQSVPIYSFGLCLSECRMFFALKVCGCVPHFYRNRLRNGRILPVCGLEGIGCLAKIKSEIISLKSDKYKINCNCLANCDDSNFFVQSYRSRVWFLGANLQWGIIDYPKMQLRRDVLFSFADVLVYTGGLVGFFLGCSALSFTEIIYYLTARFVKRMFFN